MYRPCGSGRENGTFVPSYKLATGVCHRPAANETLVDCRRVARLADGRLKASPAQLCEALRVRHQEPPYTVYHPHSTKKLKAKIAPPSFMLDGAWRHHRQMRRTEHLPPLQTRRETQPTPPQTRREKQPDGPHVRRETQRASTGLMTISSRNSEPTGLIAA